MEAVTEELEGHLRELEQNAEASLRDQRIRLGIIAQNTMYLDQKQWERYEQLCKRFRDMVNAVFPGMGS